MGILVDLIFLIVSGVGSMIHQFNKLRGGRRAIHRASFRQTTFVEYRNKPADAGATRTPRAIPPPR